MNFWGKQTLEPLLNNTLDIYFSEMLVPVYWKYVIKLQQNIIVWLIPRNLILNTIEKLSKHTYKFLPVIMFHNIIHEYLSHV
jgi:hypothetical protein